MEEISNRSCFIRIKERLADNSKLLLIDKDGSYSRQQAYEIYSGLLNELSSLINKGEVCLIAPFVRKETVLIAAAMAPDENAFEIIRKEFDHVNAVLGFEKKAELLAPGLGGPDDAGKDEALLVKAALLGTNI